MDTKDKRFWLTLVVMPLVTIVMSATSAYLTAQEMMARFDERLSVMEVKVEKAEEHRQELDDQAANINERLVRIETKQDVVIRKLSK